MRQDARDPSGFAKLPYHVAPRVAPQEKPHRAVRVEPNVVKYLHSRDSMLYGLMHDEKVVNILSTSGQLRGADDSPDDIEPSRLGKHGRTDVEISGGDPRTTGCVEGDGSRIEDGHVFGGKAFRMPEVHRHASQSTPEDRINLGHVYAMGHGLGDGLRANGRNARA